MNPEWSGPAVRQNHRMGRAGVAERKGTGTDPGNSCRALRQVRVSKRDAKEDSRNTIAVAVGGRGMMDLWL